MPSIPGSIALTNIADGASIVAADHRNNYNALQTAVNGLITVLGVTAKGDLLVATGSGALVNLAAGSNAKALIADSTQTSGVKWDYPPGYQFDYTEVTNQNAGLAAAATTEATATTFITAGAVTYDGATRIKLEVFIPRIDKGTTWLTVALYDGASSIGLLGYLNGVIAGTVKSEFIFTPSAAAHTYSVRAFVDAGTGFLYGGTGAAAGQWRPAFIRQTKA